MNASRFCVLLKRLNSIAFWLLLTTHLTIAQDNIPKKVAILPFVWADEANQSVKEKHPDALVLARDLFSKAFSSSGYDNVPLDTVDQLLTASDIENENFSALVHNGIDGIIQAELHHIAIGKGGIISRSVAEIDFTMINLNNNQIIWSVKESVSRMGGLIMNSGLLTRAFNSLSTSENERIVEINNVLLDLYTSVLASLPPAKITLDAPAIRSARFETLADDTTNQPTGFQIWLEGSAGCSAFFDLSPTETYIPFIEYAPGNYFTYYPTSELPPSILIHMENGLGIQAKEEMTPHFQPTAQDNFTEDELEVLP